MAISRGTWSPNAHNERVIHSNIRIKNNQSSFISTYIQYIIWMYITCIHIRWIKHRRVVDNRDNVLFSFRGVFLFCFYILSMSLYLYLHWVFDYLQPHCVEAQTKYIPENVVWTKRAEKKTTTNIVPVLYYKVSVWMLIASNGVWYACVCVSDVNCFQWSLKWSIFVHRLLIIGIMWFIRAIALTK